MYILIILYFVMITNSFKKFTFFIKIFLEESIFLVNFVYYFVFIMFIIFNA